MYSHTPHRQASFVCDPANRSGLLPGKPLLDLDITSFIKFVQLDAEISRRSVRLLLDIDKLRLLPDSKMDITASRSWNAIKDLIL